MLTKSNPHQVQYYKTSDPKTSQLSFTQFVNGQKQRSRMKDNIYNMNNKNEIDGLYCASKIS